MRNKPKRTKKIKCNCPMGEGELHEMTCAVMEQPKPAPACDPFIWLNSSEIEGKAQCGCLLKRDHEHCGPAFFQCPLHAAARKLLEWVKDQYKELDHASDVEGIHVKCGTGCDRCQAEELIAAAERKA